MDKAIYTAMNAAISYADRHSINANNLSNISTSGFKFHIPSSKYITVRGDSFITRVFPTATTSTHNKNPGNVNYSGNNLDVAILGEGWLAIQLEDGSEGYTKNGHIKINEEGKLTIKNFPVIGSENGALEVTPGSDLTISSDGTISAIGPGESSKSITSVGKLKLAKSDLNDLELNENGIFISKNNKILQSDESIRLIPNAFEESNVSAVDSIIKIIDDSRNFEMQMKLISNISENSKISNQILTIN
ncbi:flgF [Wigglesworthia glossinidia endosymbiont of Glossina brevipalpis]|uniref:Flagellar basal-body rod protein FlgF n=1 Tax=Wigglesworthia glossinidia brevipalpis TaxID=36870 RepID=Q8D3F9_WIGBR|nr:flgF [Wigglesworthia glossinidia endosymbiont of Glossina brevipalpis]